MNFKSIVAFLLAGAVFVLGVFTSTNNPMAFVDFHAALIVFGGTIAVAAISFQIDRIWVMLKIFYARVIKEKKEEVRPLIREMMIMSEAYRVSGPNIKTLVANASDPFLKECMSTLLEEYLELKDFEHIMRIRMNTIFNRYMEDAKKFKALGKFPPAMGLMGAVLGMIALLQTLGQAGAESNIGRAMAVALVATLYGIAFANLVILPIAENLMDSAREVKYKNEMILEGVLLIAERKNKILLAEEMNSYLLPKERVNWKQIEA